MSSSRAKGTIGFSHGTYDSGRLLRPLIAHGDLNGILAKNPQFNCLPKPMNRFINTHHAAVCVGLQV